MHLMPLRRMAVASALIAITAAACTGGASDVGRDDRTPVPALNAAQARLLPTDEIRNGLGFVGQPDTVFYHADGRIAMSWQGPLTPAALQTGLKKILPSG